MRIVLVGAPGTGKKRLTREIKRLRSEVVVVPTPKVGEAAVGQLADYRVELLLAASRALPPLTELTLWQHSLLDSVAYSSMRVSTMDEFGGVDAEEHLRWYMTLYMTTQMFMDSFKADRVFYLPGKLKDDSFNARLDGVLHSLLKGMDIEFTTIDMSCSKPLDSLAKLLEDETTTD